MILFQPLNRLQICRRFFYWKEREKIKKYTKPLPPKEASDYELRPTPNISKGRKEVDMKKAEYREEASCLQRNSAEHKEYTRPHLPPKVRDGGHDAEHVPCGSLH